MNKNKKSIERDEDLRRKIAYYKSLGYKIVFPQPKPGTLTNVFIIDFIPPGNPKYDKLK